MSFDIRFTLNDNLQLLMHKRHGGYSRAERWTATKANPTCNNSSTTSAPAASSSGIGNWTIAKQLISAVPRLENHPIGSYVIMQRSQGRYLGQVTHPEENENSFWHHSKSTGHLWTLASIKELVYNLGTSALNVSEGRYHAMKPWAFERWEAAGMVAVREILVSQFAVRSRKKQNRRFA
ncbi:hypothetical protein EV702DRAFT_1050042 [Suillus placidus]|uniref:Uncharacterized protein n=1 Tax=Suillus placidus TaxID=48579 RepID=A0A9P6ZJ42_9AGAM|nr:hypothetical protein EV702DRAFT_1050042 [Suillus placidus]